MYAVSKCSSDFADLGAQLTVIGENPDGLNINLNVGSTHPEALQERLQENLARHWFSF